MTCLVEPRRDPEGWAESVLRGASTDAQLEEWLHPPRDTFAAVLKEGRVRRALARRRRRVLHRVWWVTVTALGLLAVVLAWWLDPVRPDPRMGETPRERVERSEDA